MAKIKITNSGAISGALSSTFSRFKVAGPVFVIAAALLWSLDGIVRANLRSIPPVMLVTIEHALGLIFLLPWLVTLGRQFKKASSAAKVSLIVTSIISGVLGTAFYTAALAQVQFVPFSVVVLMQQLQPIFVVVLSTILLREKITTRFIVLALMALGGAYLINFPSLVPNTSTASGQFQLIAAVFALLAAISWGAGTIFSKFALKELDFKAATAGRFLITAIVGFAVTLALGQTIPLVNITTDQWLQLLLIVFSSGMIALLIYYRGLKHTEAKVSTFAELAWPLSAFAIDILRGFSFAPTQLIGAALLLFTIVRIARLNQEK